LTNPLSSYASALSSDPANEEINVEIMRLYALTGQRPQALRQYQALQNALRRELDVEPDLESTRLYEMIRSGQYPDTAVQRIAGSGEALSAPLALNPTTPSLPFWGARLSCLKFNAC
jgi:DNA-binding SARP family transcriptional activator